LERGSLDDLALQNQRSSEDFGNDDDDDEDPTAAYSQVEDVRIAQQFIEALKNADINNGNLSPDAVDNLFNPPEYPLELDNKAVGESPFDNNDTTNTMTEPASSDATGPLSNSSIVPSASALVTVTPATIDRNSAPIFVPRSSPPSIAAAVNANLALSHENSVPVAIESQRKSIDRPSKKVKAGQALNAKSICKRLWIEQNPTGTEAAFTAHWAALTPDQEKEFDKYANELRKTMP
ncbi:hypothetical protein H0H87_010292, partial [Tephrocybe sp. NHM501043]